MRRLRPAPPIAVVTSRLSAAGHEVVVVDGRHVVDKATALEAIRDAAAFPDWVGNNLDALADALGDLSWLVGDSDDSVAVVWGSADRLALLPERDREGLLAVLRDTEAGDGPVAAVILLDGPSGIGLD